MKRNKQTIIAVVLIISSSIAAEIYLESGIGFLVTLLVVFVFIVIEDSLKTKTFYKNKQSKRHSTIPQK